MARWLLLAPLLVACGADDDTTTDGGGVDAGPFADAANEWDAEPSPDVGVVDSGADDAGPVPVDAGTPGICDPSIGLRAPLRTCTAAEPCTNTSALDPRTRIDVPSDRPDCRTTARATMDGRGSYDDGPPRTATDLSGTTRYFCEYRPAGASSTDRRPLVVFFHGYGGDAGDPYRATLLRMRAESDRFIFVSIQGRNLHQPRTGRTDGPMHDWSHRDLGSPSGNPDVAFADAVIDGVVADGVVDPQRIHVMGWSNGGFFAQMYAIARHETATPGGARVASAAIFSSGDPFHDIVDGEPCRLDPYPRSAVPILVAGRSCDLLPCDSAQAAELASMGVANPPGYEGTTWVADLRGLVGSSDARHLLISGVFEIAGREVTRCSRTCPVLRATTNHIQWPDGVADGSGRDNEATMVAFLTGHPLP